MQGTLTWPFKNVSKHKLPITVMWLAASVSAPRPTQWLSNLDNLGTAPNVREAPAEKTGWLERYDAGVQVRNMRLILPRRVTVPAAKDTTKHP